MYRVRIFLFAAVMLVVFFKAYAQETALYTEVNPQNYQQEVTDSQGPQIVFFFARWCPFSGSLIPIYEEIEKEYTGRIEFCRFELGKEYMDFQTPEGQARWETLNKEYGIDTIPCLVMRTQGKELDRMSGRPEKEIVDSYRMLFTQWIDSNLITPEGTPYRFEGTLRLRQNKIEGE